MSELIKISGLWKSTDKNGKTILTGSLNPISKLVIMPNTFKIEGDKSTPDYFVYIAQNELKKNNPISKKESDL